MARRSVVAAAVLSAALLVSIASAAPAPYLRSVGIHRGHIVAVFALAELGPGQIAVAVKPTTEPSGAFVAANVRLKESMRPTRVANGYRWQTRHTLRPGRYYVQVSGIVLGLDCLPRKPCPMRWSNARRATIPRPSR
jgi:hypothetical protein